MKSTRRGSDPPVHRPEKTPRFQIQLDKWPLSPGTPREASGVPCLNPRRGLTLLSPVCRDPAIGVLNQRNTEVPASTGDEALFQCTKPRGVPRGPPPPPVSLTSQSHHEKPPEVTCTSRGKPGFPASTRERPRETFFNT